LAECLASNNRADSASKLKVRDIALCQKLLQDINESDNNILISSEAIQNLNPEQFGELFIDKNVCVLVYLRNPQDYLASAYAQKVGANRYTESIEYYFDHIFDLNYSAFLDKWENVFPGKIRVRKFARDQLHSNDIVVDFFVNMLNIQNEELIKVIMNRATFDSNPSLTTKLLQFKLRFNFLNVACSQKEEGLLRNALGTLSQSIDDRPVKLDHELANRVAEKFHTSNIDVSNKYFNGQPLFEMKKGARAATELTDDDFTSIIDQLKVLDPRLNDLMGKLNDTQGLLQRSA